MLLRGNKRGCNRRSGDGDCQYNCKPPSSRPERRDVPSTTAPGPARPPAAAAPPAAAQSRGAASPRAAGTSRPGRAQTPCVFFAKGSCRNGAHCPFAHVKADDVPDVSQTKHPGEEAPDSPPRRPSGVAICRFFAQGLCRNGANCRFSHGETKASAQAPSLVRRNLIIAETVRNGRTTDVRLDVECVATGKTHNDRAVAQIGLVDAYGRCVLNVYVKTEKRSGILFNTSHWTHSRVD